MKKIIFYKENKESKKMEKCIEYNCKKIMFFDNIVVMNGVDGSNAEAIRIPLFRIDMIETFE